MTANQFQDDTDSGNVVTLPVVRSWDNTEAAWQQERPSWCPHSDCGFLVRSQDAICIGKLPTAQMHDGIENTHRLCQRGAPDDGEWLHKVEWNKGDAWNLWRCLNAAFGFGAKP